MAYDFSSLLSMAQAHFVSEAAQPQQKDEQLTVFWENIPPQLLREAREWLVENRLSVADFTVEHKQYEGTWHLVSLQAGEQVKTGRVQAVFQKGYATSLTWALARLTNAKLAHTNASTAGVADSSSDNPIRYLNVRFPNIDRRAVNSIISGIAATYTDVELSSETYSGEWHVVYATSGLQQEGQKDNDGAAFIEIFLAKPQYTLQTKRSAGTPQERTVWYCWDVPQAIAQSVIDTFEGTGTSVSANNNSAQNLVDLILESSTPESGQRFSLSSIACSQRVYDYVYRSVSNPDAYALPSTSTDGVIYSREEALNDDGTYNVFIKATLSRSRIFEFESFSAPFASESTISYRANTGVIQAPPSGLGGVYRLRQDVNPDCTYDADLTYKAGLNAGEALFGSERGGLSTEDRAVYRDRTSQVTAPEPGQRGIYQADNQLTEEGLYNSTLQYRTSTARELEFESQATKFRRQSEHVYRNSDTPITAPIPGAGGLYRVEQQINPDLTYDARLVYTAGNSQGQAKFVSQSSELVTEASIIYRDIPNQIDAPSTSQGRVYQATNQLTDEGLYNASLQYQVSRPDVAKFKSQATKFRSESTITYRNSRAVIEAPTPASSGVYRVSQRENQDGTYDAELVYSSGSNAGEVSFFSEKSSLLNEDTAIYRDRSNKVDANLSFQGVVYQATNQLTDEGLYNAQVVGRASVEGKIDFKSRSTPFRTEQVSTYRNTKAMPSVPSVTTGAYQMSAQLNTDGTYDVSVAYTTKSGSNSEVVFTSDTATLSKSESAIYKDRTQKIEAPSSGQGYVYRADNQMTEDGLYNASLQYTASQEAVGSIDSRKTKFRTQQSWIYKNEKSWISSLPSVENGVYSLTADINRDGTYDMILQYDRANGDGAYAKYNAVDAAASLNISVLYRERSAPVETSPNIQGVIYRASNSLGDDGTYNGELSIISSYERSKNFVDVISPTSHGHVEVYDSSKNIPVVSHTGHGLYNLSDFRLNDDGTYSGRVLYRISKNTETSFTSSEDSQEKNTNIIYSGRTDKLVCPVATYGVSYAIQGQSQEQDGTYSATLVQSEAIELDSGWMSTSDDSGLTLRRVFVNIPSTTRDSILSSITNVYRADWSVNPSRYKDRWSGSIAMREVPSDSDLTDKGGKNIKYNLATEDGTYNVYVRLTRSRIIARDHVYGNVKKYHGGHTAGIVWKGNGWWQATRIGPQDP